MRTVYEWQVSTTNGIRSIPTVMMYRTGQKVDTIFGAVSEATLVQFVNKYTL
jgi:thioredoxin-like negative regulator of GroEL